MTVGPEWAAPIGAVVAGVTLFIYWRVLDRGWRRDIERERLMREEWSRTHPAE